MRIRLLGVGVKMGIVDGGHAQSDDVIRCPETFADHEYILRLLQSVAHKRIKFNALGGSSLNIINGRQFQTILPYPASPTDVKVEEVRTAVFWILWDQAALASPDSESVNINASLHRLKGLEFQWNPWDYFSQLSCISDHTGGCQGSHTASGLLLSIPCRSHEQSTIPLRSSYVASTCPMWPFGSPVTQDRILSRQYVDWNQSLRRVTGSTFEDVVSGDLFEGPPVILEPSVNP
jgi:hypothetical protein